MEFCYISSLSEKLLTMRVLSGGSPIAPMSRKCWYFVQVSSHCHHSTLVNCNRQIREDLGVPFFAIHFRFINERFNSKLADVGKPLVRQLSIYLCWRSVDPGLVKLPRGIGIESLVVASCRKVAMSTEWIVSSWNFRLHWLRVFSVFFPRLVVRRKPGYNKQSWARHAHLHAWRSPLSA